MGDCFKCVALLVRRKERRKIDDAFRGNINGRLKHHLYRKLGSLNRRQEIYFQRKRGERERERERMASMG